LVKYNSAFYSLSAQYQLIYWAGCNSYSYYTEPFFKQKAALETEPSLFGPKNLDIINNGLPSLFSFNAANAMITYNAIMNWENKTSYQSIVNQIENFARNNNYVVLVNVLGDEDNL
jgi:hypothetical protein